MTRNGMSVPGVGCDVQRARRKRWGIIAGGILLLGFCVVVRWISGSESASAQAPTLGRIGGAPPAAARESAGSPGALRSGAIGTGVVSSSARQAAPRSGSNTAPGAAPAAAGRGPTTVGEKYAAGKPEVVAVVNGEPITRAQLGQECLRHYGNRVLEGMVNRHLIQLECQRRKLTVTRQEVDAEIERMAQRFGLPVDQWLKLLKQERGISPYQYANDIVWPMLALRKLAGDRLEVTHQELVEAFESQYGPAVDVRMIVCASREKAEQVRAEVQATPEAFGTLARKYSEDASASLNGRVQPIRKHCGQAEIEQAAFMLADGEISPVIPAGGQYVILRREQLLPAPKTIRFEQVAPRLEEMIRDRKLRRVSAEVFRQLQDAAKVENVWNDPARRREMPGVAALINGQAVTLAELAEQCIDRHGEDVLEGVINRKLIEQACKKRNIAVSEAELDAEVARAAAVMVPPKADGSPDVETWLATVTESQDVSVEVYRNDAVWPSVALKKLVGNDVKVSEEDLKRGFEANYGRRVRCRAIVMSNFRRAQEVWEKARENPTVDRFGDLAEQYSIEPASQALRGEVPPIARHGGQPVLEEEAFKLQPGELSGIIQVEDKFVILLCEGYTEPTQVTFDEVRQLIYDDLFEKKQRLAMADYFQHLQDSASIDNYLAGTSRSPAPTARAASTPLPTLKAVSPR